MNTQSEATLPQLTRAMRGWYRMWQTVRAKYGDTECLDVYTKEQWQYMGSYNGYHELRHRWLRGQRHYEMLPVMPGDYDVSESSCDQSSESCSNNPSAQWVSP